MRDPYARRAVHKVTNTDAETKLGVSGRAWAPRTVPEPSKCKSISHPSRLRLSPPRSFHDASVQPSSLLAISQDMVSPRYCHIEALKVCRMGAGGQKERVQDDPGRVIGMPSPIP